MSSLALLPHRNFVGLESQFFLEYNNRRAKISPINQFDKWSIRSVMTSLPKSCVMRKIFNDCDASKSFPIPSRVHVSCHLLDSKEVFDVASSGAGDCK